MKKNRRNYYRILHVQPEAPDAIIRASYRMLMGPLRNHPDRGGDHATAALLNEAWAVLGDPERRRAYDRQLAKEIMRRPPGDPGAVADVDAGHGAVPEAGGNAGDWRPQDGCPFCAQVLPGATGATANCPRCGSPLAPPPAPDARMRELFGKRASARFARDRPVTLVPAWGERPLDAVMADISLSGIRLLVPEPVQVHQAIRISDRGMEAVARVVSTRRERGRWSVHGRFVTLRLDGLQGRFVSEQA